MTSRDLWLSLGVALGITIGITLLWTRLRVAYPGNQYVKSFSLMAYTFAYLLTMPFTSLKGRSRGTQMAMLGGTLFFLTAISLLAGLILTARH